MRERGREKIIILLYLICHDSFVLFLVPADTWTNNIIHTVNTTSNKEKASHFINVDCKRTPNEGIP